VRKYDAQGNELWIRQFRVGDTVISDVILDTAGNIYVAGSTDRGTFFHRANGDVFVAKIADTAR